MKVLIPSSIQASRRSSEPTIIGNQECPISCAEMKNRVLALSLMPSKTIPGYSMPVAGPATLIALGQGYGYQRLENRSTASFMYSVERLQAFSPTLSGG